MKGPDTSHPKELAPSRKLRVVAVGRQFNDSGSLPTHYARNCERLALDEDLIAVCSNVARRPTSAPITFIPVDSIFPEPGRALKALSLGDRALRATRIVRRLRDHVDVVHVDGVSALEADVVTVHAVSPADAERYWTQVRPAGPVRRLVATLARPRSLVERAIERRLVRQMPLCLAVTQMVRDDLQRIHGVPGELIEIVPYPVDLRAFAFDEKARAARRASLGVPENRLVVLFVGDDLVRKGVHRAIAAIARTHTHDSELWVVGGRELDRWVAEARQCGVADRVRLFGRRPSGELPSWYSAADVVLLPSERDVWGIPVIEGLAAGRVVAVSAFAGASQVIENGRNGFILDRDGHPDQIAALLDGPLADPRARKVVEAAGRNAAAPFDTEIVYRRFRAAHHRAYALRLARGAA